MPLATLITILAMPGVAQAQSGPAATVESPLDRARRDAEKVYQMILQQSDKPRKTREERVSVLPVVSRVAPGAAPTGSSTPKAPSAAAGSPLAVASPEQAVAATEPTERAAPETTKLDAGASQLQAETRESPNLLVHQSPVAMAFVPASGSASVPLPTRTTTPTPREQPAAPRVLELVSSVEPDFPSYLLRRLGQGSVVVNFDVLPDGSVGAAAVAKSTHHGLNAAALAAVTAWRFKPGSATTAGTTELRFE